MNPVTSTAEVLDLSQFDTQGFSRDYPILRHRFEALANLGCHEARTDWIQYVGPVAEFGGCNTLNGNFTALVLPMCKPERLQLVAYILEYAFLHDNVVESITTTSGHAGDEWSLGDHESRKASVKEGRTQIQAKMMLGLTSTDKVCAERVMRVWKTMLSTTLKDKAKDFTTLEEYLDFRIVDTGAPFVEAIMLFGMGMTLTTEEDELVADIVRPCYASLALANDYFSFDREWQEAQEEGASKPLNAVYLYMKWQGVTIAEAKQHVRKATNHFEKQFLELCDRFRQAHPGADKLSTYLQCLSYQVSGNVVWSLNCPRYHPEYRYDPNAGLENIITAQKRLPLGEPDNGRMDSVASQNHHRESIVSMGSEVTGADSTWSGQCSRSSSVSELSEAAESEDRKVEAAFNTPAAESLGLEYVNAPIEYVASMPSKGVRGTFIDALNLWSKLSDNTVSQIKELVDTLHTASLMFDDVEDGSDLRRGNPAAHAVFGIPQTINAASFAIVEAISKANEIPVPGGLKITLEQLKELHVGQSHDLYWTRHSYTPSEAEYLEMVSKKTGGLFRLVSRLMSAELPSQVQASLTHLVTLVGIYFQIRDDYQNLSSDEYTAQKGFCEDLDEGKISFPLVHYMNSLPERKTLLVREMMQQRRDKGRMTVQQKRLVLKCLEEGGSLGYTRDKLRVLHRQCTMEIARLEEMMGTKNWVLRLCLQKLAV